MPEAQDLTTRALTSLLTELVDGAPADFCWVLDPGRPGLLGVLESVSVETAYQSLRDRPPIAAHTQHLLFHLQLLNRWAGGEENPFAGADWAASWQPGPATTETWAAMRSELRHSARSWIAAAQQPRDWDEVGLTGAVASAVHLAYHMGAIKQILALDADR